MPRPKRPPTKVRCPSCQLWQDDLGTRTTCERCGFQPIPSRDYPPDCCFHPDYRRPQTVTPPKRRGSVLG